MSAVENSRQKSNSMRSMFCTLTVYALFTAVAVGAGQEEKYLGPCALVASRDGQLLYVANADSQQVAVVEPVVSKVAAILSLSGEPTGLALSPDETRLYVTCAGPRSTAVVIDLGSRRTIAAMAAGHTAMSPVVSPDGKRVFVCNRFDNDVSILDVGNVADRPDNSISPRENTVCERAEACAPGKSGRVKMVREPVAAALTPDGKMLVVGNHLSADRSDAFYSTAMVTLVDTSTREATPVRLPDGATGLRGVCISPDGKYAYATHTLANYQLVPSQVSYGWMNTNSLSIIDLTRKQRLDTVQLDDADLGAANPWGVACSPDGKWLCVVHAGTDELSVIDAPALIEKLKSDEYAAPLAGGVTHNPGMLAGLRRRVKLPGKGPRGLAVVGWRAYVAEYFSDTLVSAELAPGAERRVTTIALGGAPKLSMKRRGEMLFNDATICFQHWQSCATCHPDARADGLNWDLMNDGVGNPKNSKSMLLSHRTPPAMSAAVRETAEIAVRSGMTNILFADRPEQEAAAIDEYLRSLRPAPSPYRADGHLSPAAQRGRQLFENPALGCSRCHPAPLYTDLRSHNVGTRNAYDHGREFDTPTLIECWRTAPYLHDGRHATLKEVFTMGNHGNVEKLDARQIDDLVEFVSAL